MTIEKKNRLAFKYIFTFRISRVEVLKYVVLAKERLSLLDMDVSDEEFPVGWNFKLRQSKYYTGAWKIKLTDKKEAGDVHESDYTFVVDYNLDYEKEVIEFLKFLDVFEDYYYTRRGAR
jgi:hypothetical protein